MRIPSAINADATSSLIIIGGFGFQLILDAGGENNDGCLSIDRALVFTGGYSHHVALTFLTRTFERLIWPSPKS